MRKLKTLIFTLLLVTITVLISTSRIDVHSVPNEIVIDLPDSSAEQLKNYIDHAKTQEVIPPVDKEYVKAYLKSGNKRVKIKMRLKGDWTDHLNYGYPSYRIKIKGDYNFHSLKEFSVQHPRTRNFLHEWIIHRIAEEEDVLTTKYGFTSMQIGEDHYDYYAYEEHFAKQLLERRNRREGPILKMDEQTTWDFLSQGYPQATMNAFPYFEASEVSVFKANRTSETPSLNQAFCEGQKLVRHFKEGTASLTDIFDIDQLVKYYVIMELSGSDHGLRWHNRRFYYNPVTQKLEHIIFDVVPHNNPEDMSVNLMKKRMKSGAVQRAFNFDASIFLDPLFKERYLYHLNRMTSEDYYRKMLSRLWPKMSDHDHVLNAVHEDYYFDHKAYYNRIQLLRERADSLNNFWNLVLEKRDSIDYWQRSIHYQSRKDTLFAASIGIKSYAEELDSNKGYRILIENYHVNEVKLKGYYVEELADTLRFRKPILLEGYEWAADSISMITDFKPDGFIYEIANQPGVNQSIRLNKWPKPKGFTTRMRLKKSFNPDNYLIKDDLLILRGEIIFDELCYIPEEYDVVVKPGTQIRFKNAGGLIICGSLNASGTIDNPIQFKGLDDQNNGLTVLNARYAKFDYVQFDGLSNLDYENWQLTGALSIYQTPTLLEHIVASNNHSEDGINLIRCPFQANFIKVVNTYSDGIDLDFCKGQLSHVNISQTGNDAIDLSGSVVKIIHVQVDQSGDKGISGGEASKILLEDVSIAHAITGVVSKDASVIIGEDINVSHVQFGTGAFCKKVEYGPAIIDLKEYTLVDHQDEYLLDNGSVIQTNDHQEIGENQLNIDSLYAPFEK